jgi:transposase
MTPELLRAVAKIYIDNVGDAPRAAVAKAFGVSPRTASRYVDAAREAKLLPLTTRGRKKA